MTFKGVRKLAAREDNAPKATAVRRCLREVLSAAALQGAHAVVNTATDRSATTGTDKLTGVWTDESGRQSEKAE